jgi:sugar phosphate isomerase/epimerase
MLEFMVFSQVKTLAEACSVVRQAAVPGAGVLVDALHLWRSGGTVADLATLKGEELAYIQLCDARATPPRLKDLRAEARGDRFYPGDGGLDLASLLAALPAGLPLSVEAPCAAHAALPAVERGRLCGERTRAFITRLSGRAP